MKTNIKPVILALGLGLLLLAPQTSSGYYNPTTGRWLSRDPEEEAGGVGLYGFVDNCPVGAIDDLGLVIVGFYGADTSAKDPNAGNQRLEEISADMERYERVLRPKNESRAHPLYTSRAVSQALVELLFYLDTNHDGFYDPPCDEEQVIKIFGWSWGGASAVELANRIKKSDTFKKKDVGLVAVIDPVTFLRTGNTEVPDTVYRFWNRFQRNGRNVMPLGLPNHGHVLQIANPSRTIADQRQLDPNGRIETIDHISIIWAVEREFVAQFFL